MRRLFLALVLGSTLSFGACSSSTTNEGPASGGTGGTSTGGTSTGGTSTGGTSTGGTSDGGSGGISTGGASTGGSGGTSADGGILCPTGKKGPALIAVGSNFCIDATEVTNHDYQKFLADPVGAGTNLTGLSACQGVLDYAPGTTVACPTFAPGVDQNYPVRCIDWCGAYAYCKWAGKRLCGKISGGAAGPPDASTNQWYSACAGPKAEETYFYGSSHEGGRCVDAPPVAAVGSTLSGGVGCESFLYPGLTDMLGNVAEWEDSCANPQSATSDCGTRGGSALQVGSAVPCAASKTVDRSSQLPGIGFRCCWDSSVDK